MSDIVIWILLIFTFLIIIGLYSSEFTPLNLSEKKKILELNYITENFTPSSSSSTDQSSGASELYNWGEPEEIIYAKAQVAKKCEHKCNEKCPQECPKKCNVPPPTKSCIEPPKNVNLKEVCNNCDITLNKNIDKNSITNNY